MPQIRAEQVLELTLKDAQVAEDANIKQSKIEDWQSDPAGWISKGIIKPVTTAELPNWDASYAGQFYYDMNTNELFFGISTDPYYQIIMGSSDGVGGGFSGSDKTIILKMSADAENWSGVDENDVSGTASRFAVDNVETSGGVFENIIAADGSNITVYLNGVLQELGSGADYILIEEQPRGADGNFIPDSDPVGKIVFNYNLEGPDQKVTAIVNNDASLVNYATKAYVDNKFYGETAHDHDGTDSNRLDFNTSITEDSLGAIIYSIIPNSNAVDLGSSSNKFGNIYAESGHFDASTIYIGNVAISGLGDKLQASLDGGANFTEVPLSKNDAAPTEVIAGTGQEVIIESTVGITAKGDILPDMTGAVGPISTRNIGSDTQKFNSIYADEVFVGASSLYVNGKKVIQDVSDTMTFQTDPDQGMVVKTQSSTPGSGNGNLSLESQNEINILADGGFLINVPSDVSNSQMNFVNDSSGGNITFNAQGSSSQVQISAAEEIDLTANLIDVNGNINISGNLIVSGTTTTINTETLSTADNMILLNSNTTGLPTQDSGIEIERGDSINYLFIFDEGDDVFKVGEFGALQSVATREDSPTANAIPTWNAVDNRFDTTSVTISGSTITGSLNGNAFSATKLQTSRGISLSGDVTGTTTFDGTGDVTITTAVADNTHNHDSSTITDAFTASTPDTIVKRDGSGDIHARLFRSEFDSTNSNIGYIMTQVDTASDNYLRPSTLGQLASSMEAANVSVKYNGATPAAGNFYTGATDPTNVDRLNYDGYFYATRVYNAVYNDLAEFMECGCGDACDCEPGEVLVMTEKGVVKSQGRGDGAVVGVYSDTYGYALGADDKENKIPVGLSGRVNVWVKEPCKIGDLLVSGDKPGFASVKKSSEDSDGKVIGKVIQAKNDSTPERISMLIMMK